MYPDCNLFDEFQENHAINKILWWFQNRAKNINVLEIAMLNDGVTIEQQIPLNDKIWRKYQWKFRLWLEIIRFVSFVQFHFAWILRIWFKIQVAMYSIEVHIDYHHIGFNVENSWCWFGFSSIHTRFGNWIRIWRDIAWCYVNERWLLCCTHQLKYTNTKKLTYDTYDLGNFHYVAVATTLAQNSFVGHVDLVLKNHRLLNSMHDDSQWSWWFDCYSWASANDPACVCELCAVNRFLNLHRVKFGGIWSSFLSIRFFCLSLSLIDKRVWSAKFQIYHIYKILCTNVAYDVSMDWHDLIGLFSFKLSSRFICSWCCCCFQAMDVFCVDLVNHLLTRSCAETAAI